jgi:U3 small nucleolar RNA-associated protein MPP10
MGVPIMAPEAAGGKPLLSSAVAALGEGSLEPMAFLAPSADLASTVRSAAKDLFDFTASHLRLSNDGILDGKMALPELHSEGFDAEQIWLQLEMQSQPVLAKLKKRIRKLVRKVEGTGPEALLSVPEEPSKTGKGNGSDQEDEADVGSESEGEEGLRFDSDDFSDEEGEDDFEEDDENVEGLEDRRGSGSKAGVSGKKGQRPVEDEFLSLEDMEKFLQDAEDRNQREGGPDEDEDEAEGDEDPEDEGIKYEEFYGRKEGASRKGSKRKGRKEEDDWGGEAFSDEELEGRSDEDANGMEDEEADELAEADGAGGEEVRPPSALRSSNVVFLFTSLQCLLLVLGLIPGALAAT